MKSFRIKKTKEQIAQQAVVEEKAIDQLSEFFSLLSEVRPTVEEAPELIAEESVEVITEVAEEIHEEILIPTAPTVVDVVAKSIKESAFEVPEIPKIPNDVAVLTKKVADLQNWITKIAMAGPGSGETRLLFLDDVNRSTVADGRWLKYDGASKKLVFDEINPFEVVHNTTSVTANTYTLQDNDYYIGVNNPNSTTITLTTASSGRMVIIKDESGNASTNPITVVGTVDNDVGGFVIQLDNGSVQLIYRNGWRII